MLIQVEQELCTGCGACVDTCPTEAIRLVDQRAKITEALCTQCEACIAACPNRAIAASLVPTLDKSAAVPLVFEPQPVLAVAKPPLPEAARSSNGLMPLAGAALAYLGSEVAPRLVDMLVNVLEHKLTQPIMTVNPPIPASPPIIRPRGRGRQLRTRYRGGSASTRNHNERR